MSSNRSKILVRLVATGQTSFSPEEHWAKQILGDKACSHCENVYEKIDSIDVVVSNKSKKTDIDLFGRYCGRVRALSTRLIEIVGLKQIERVAGIGKIMDIKGFEHVNHRTAIARNDAVIIRGHDPSTAGLCRKCDRLLFGAVGEKYVLRSQIPPEPFFLSDGHIFCTDEYWEDHFSKFPWRGLEATEVPILDKPQDDLPATLQGIKKSLRLKRKYK